MTSVVDLDRGTAGDRSRPARPTGGAEPTTPLARAVAVGLQTLGDLSQVDYVATIGRLENRLRTVLAEPGEGGGRVATRVACAHLSAGQFTDAYSALLTAQDQLSRRVAPS